VKSPLKTFAKAVTKKSDTGPPVPLTGAKFGSQITSIFGGYRGGDPDRQIEMYKHNTPLHSAAGFNAQALAGIQWRLFQHADGRGRISGPDPRKEITNHQAVRVWNRPNPFMHGSFFREFSQLHVELTGLAYWVVVRTGTIPTSMWPVKRSAIVPIPDPDKYLLGYAYLPEDGAKPIPLGIDEVIPIQTVDPSDPLGGCAPAQPLMTDMDSAQMTSEFRRNFFRNSANPGGIIQIEQDTNLSDEEFEELSERWAEQHRGVRNAHRVAIIERGKWIRNDSSLKDMQFVELRQDDRDVVYEGYRTSKSLMGVTEDVNRANAEANEYVYAKWNLVPKLSRYRDALNVFYLPMFSSAANGEYTWDFDNPSPADWQADAATTAANANAAAQLVLAGYDPQDVANAMSLPNLRWRGLPSSGTAEPSDKPQARLDRVNAEHAAALRQVAALTSWGSF
jgi:HK97 family phage portal protein